MNPLHQGRRSRSVVVLPEERFPCRWIFILLLMALPFSSSADGISPAGGLRVSSVLGPQESGEGAPGAPLEGPLVRLALTVTDEASSPSDYDWYAWPSIGVIGNPLPSATTDTVIALLDSGAGTHLLAYEHAQALGLSGAWLTGNTFAAGGVGGFIDLLVSQPAGFFAQGLQDLSESGSVQSALCAGHWNFAAGVNSEENFLAGHRVPSVLGVPVLASFAALVRISEPVRTNLNGEYWYTPSVTFFEDAGDTNIPAMQHKVFISPMPEESLTIAYLPDTSTFEEPVTPSTVGLASDLFFTTSDMTFSEAGAQTKGKAMVDTGAQVTLISEIAAAELGLDLGAPDFVVEVQGIAGSTNAPGFLIDTVGVPALGGALVWTNVPVVVLNLASPAGGTLFGVFGMNLLANRDFVFNGIAVPPFLDISGPAVDSLMKITSLHTAESGMEVGWRNEPAPPCLVLDSAESLAGAWQPVATAAMSTVEGVFTLTNDVPPARFFRLRARRDA